MSGRKDYQANRELWNSRVDAHIDSDFYDHQGFLEGRNSLNAPELELLGDVAGLRILHLQCHFGQDSLSLARMGARVTGVDISDQAIMRAREINHQLQLDAEFVCCNVLEVTDHIDEKFDLVFASYGTIGWIETLDPYFKNVERLLSDDGRYLIVDFHPVYWMFNDDLSAIEYAYFNRGPIIEEVEGSYASADANPKMKEYGWNHPFDEIIGAVHKAGMRLVDFREYDFSPYDIFKNGTRGDQGYQVKGLEGKIPLIYSLVAAKS